MHKTGYSVLLSSGELKKRVDILREMLKNCVICPHQCKINRLKGEKG